MDVICDYIADYVHESVAEQGIALPVALGRQSLASEALIYFTVTLLGGYVMYLLFAGLSYLFFFVLFQRKFNPDYRFNAKELGVEISTACWAIPYLALLTTPLWMYDARHTYKHISDFGIPYFIFSIFFFIAFTDFCIYWIHRWLHHKSIYGYLHKMHHHFISPTPFASHAFHPVDAWLQAMPYHIFVALFPMHNWLLLFMFVFVNFWTISIHDRVRLSNDYFVNGAKHHKIHHSHFVYNYGQYTTIWDRIGGTYLEPGTETTRKVPKKFD